MHQPKQPERAQRAPAQLEQVQWERVQPVLEQPWERALRVLPQQPAVHAEQVRELPIAEAAEPELVQQPEQAWEPVQAKPGQQRVVLLEPEQPEQLVLAQQVQWEPAQQVLAQPEQLELAPWERDKPEQVQLEPVQVQPERLEQEQPVLAQLVLVLEPEQLVLAQPAQVQQLHRRKNKS